MCDRTNFFKAIVVAATCYKSVVVHSSGDPIITLLPYIRNPNPKYEYVFLTFMALGVG